MANQASKNPIFVTFFERTDFRVFIFIYWSLLSQSWPMNIKYAVAPSLLLVTWCFSGVKFLGVIFRTNKISYRFRNFE